ncbi:MAG: flavodoxin family protein [Bacillota bacterium]
MKVLIFNGSPRKGNTLTAIRAIERGIESRADAADIEVTRIDTEGKNIIPCKACNACGSMSRCIFADDSPEINEAVEAADVIVFATPVYWWGVTAQLKLVIDKFYSRASRLGKGKRVATVVIGGAELSNPEYEIIQKQFECIADYLGWEIVFAKSIFASDPKDLAGDEENLADLEAFGAGL